MKKLTLSLLIVAAAFVTPTSLFAQQSTGSSIRGGQDNPKTFPNSSPQGPNRDHGRAGSSSSTGPYAGSGTISVRRWMPPYSKIEKYLQPTKQQKKMAASFLSSGDTGIARLWAYDYDLPEGVKATLDNQVVYDACKYYSFSEKLHFPYAADIMVDEDLLRTGVTSPSFGSIVSLGEIDLGSVNLETPEAAKMMSVKFPETLEELGKLQTSHAKSTSAVVGQAYLIRSMIPEFDDSLIVFKIIEKDSEGSLLLFWKRLYRSDAPKFKKQP